jgi:hypothetical protein
LSTMSLAFLGTASAPTEQTIGPGKNSHFR